MSSTAIDTHTAAMVVFDQVDLGAAAEAAELERKVTAAVALWPLLPPFDPNDPYNERALSVTWLVDLARTSRRSYFLAVADWLVWCQASNVAPLKAKVTDTTKWKSQMTAQKRGKGNTIELVAPSANTVNKRLSALSSWYGWLQDNDLEVLNPASRTKRPKRPKRSRYPALSADELARFLAWLVDRAERLGTEEAWRDAAMFTLMFNTGLRISAVIGAQFGDIGFESDGQDSYLVLHYTKKGGETDWVPLTEAVLAVLHRYWQVRGERIGMAAEDLTGFLFVTTPHPKRPELVGGKQCTQNRTFDHLRVLARQFGLTAADTMTLHSTRRTAGTLALASGAPLDRVQDLLGHADPRTTRDGYDANRHRLSTSPVHTIAHALAEASQRLRQAVDENAPDPEPT